MRDALTFGIYILADDNSLQWTSALLKSLRHHNPAIPVCIIPFSSNVSKLSEYARSHSLIVFSQQSLLDRCDDIAMNFHGEKRGYYRKLCAWEGPFQSFAYIDADSVVIMPLRWLIDLLAEHSLIFADGPTPGNRKHVWKRTIHHAGVLTPRQIHFSANAGFFASHKGLFPIHYIESCARAAYQLKVHMMDGASDQPFLNYLAVTAPSPPISLRTLSKRSAAASIPIAWWGGAPGAFAWRGSLLRIPRLANPTRRVAPIFLIHWAGSKAKTIRPKAVNPILYIYEWLKLRFEYGPYFRYRKLWLFYANLEEQDGASMQISQR